jgi:hypothetical protein
VRTLIGALSAGLTLSATTILAQTVPTFELTAPIATSPDIYGHAVAVQELPNGSLIVNDARFRQLIRVDQDFRNRLVVLDTFRTRQGYGAQTAALFRFAGDSLMLVSRDGYSIIDNKDGHVRNWVSARTWPPVTAMRGLSVGVDRRGRFIFQTEVSIKQQDGKEREIDLAAEERNANEEPEYHPFVDSLHVIRMPLTGRTKLQPVVRLNAQKFSRNRVQTSSGKILGAHAEINVLPLVDEFVVFSDGTVAVLRASDYRFDFVDDEGRVKSGARIPFVFDSISLATRQAMVDSAREVQERAKAANVMTEEREQLALAVGTAAGRAAQINAGRPDAGFRIQLEPSMDQARGSVRSSLNRPGQYPIPFAVPTGAFRYMPADSLTAVRQPFVRGSLVIDRNDNIWVRTTARDELSADVAFYDVVDRAGVLQHRVRVPESKKIIGFSRNGDIFLTGRQGFVSPIERVSLKR